MRGHHDLVGGLAPAALAAHAVGKHGQRAARFARMGDDFDLVLLVRAVASVQARGSVEAVRARGRAHLAGTITWRLSCHRLQQWNENLHSPQRRLIELRIEHADLDSLIDRGGDGRRSTT